MFRINVQCSKIILPKVELWKLDFQVPEVQVTKERKFFCGLFLVKWKSILKKWKKPFTGNSSRRVVRSCVCVCVRARAGFCLLWGRLIKIHTTLHGQFELWGQTWCPYNSNTKIQKFCPCTQSPHCVRMNACVLEVAVKVDSLLIFGRKSLNLSSLCTNKGLSCVNMRSWISLK